MPQDYFQFRQFKVDQKASGMKVTTDACLFGAWVAHEITKKGSEPARILDIGSGTGLLSLMLAQATQKSVIHAVEIHPAAAKESSANFSNAPWSDRTHGFQLDIQRYQPRELYDVILCNPPFFAAHGYAPTKLEKHQATHEVSLRQETLGFHVSRLLKPNGSFYLLYPEYEMGLFQKRFDQTFFLATEIIVRNHPGAPGLRKMSAFTSEKLAPNRHEICIRDKNNKYSQSFWDLLEPYYLPFHHPNL